MLSVALGAIIGSALNLGCASSYHPMVTPRVQVVQTGAGLAFVRAGKQYDHGVFGGGLAEAVQGVPAAVDHANSYSSLQIAGFAFTIGGSAAVTAGAIQAARNSDEGVESSAIALLIGGAAADIVGLILYASAQPHLWDAINVHNDAIQRAAVEQWRRSRAAPSAQQP